MTSRVKYTLEVIDPVTRRPSVLLEHVTATDRQRIDKYLVGSNWRWSEESGVDNPPRSK